jgi:hypothetical protein
MKSADNGSVACGELYFIPITEGETSLEDNGNILYGIALAMQKLTFAYFKLSHVCRPPCFANTATSYIRVLERISFMR